MNTKLIFVGGSPRSGTTLLQKILNNHQDIYGGPEFDHIPSLMGLYKKMQQGISNERQAVYYNQEVLASNFKLFLEAFFSYKAQISQVKMISEKTPDNVLVFSELVEILPDAKFIFVVRDPRAILNSFKQVRKRAVENKIKNYGDFGNHIFTDLLRIYKSINLGNEFHKKYNKKCFIVYYEKLVSSPDIVIKHLCNFLGISFDTNILNTAKEDDISRLVEKQNKTELPFQTKLLNQRIQMTAMNKWKKSLKKDDLLLCNAFFKFTKMDCLERYDIPKLNFLQKITVVFVVFFKMITYLWYFIKKKLSKIARVFKIVSKFSLFSKNRNSHTRLY